MSYKVANQLYVSKTLKNEKKHKNEKLSKYLASCLTGNQWSLLRELEAGVSFPGLPPLLPPPSPSPHLTSDWFPPS